MKWLELVTDEQATPFERGLRRAVKVALLLLIACSAWVTLAAVGRASLRALRSDAAGGAFVAGLAALDWVTTEKTVSLSPLGMAALIFLLVYLPWRNAQKRMDGIMSYIDHKLNPKDPWSDDR
jgi:hypothetical protein